MVGSWEVYHLKGEDLRAEVGSVTKHDGQVDLPKWVRLCPRDHTMEGRAHGMELQLGDVHGIEGVDIEDVEAVPPSISTLVRRFLRMMGSTTSG